MANNYEDLERLNRLRKDGAITEAEFEQEKAKLLNKSNQQRNSMNNQQKSYNNSDKNQNGGYAMALHLVQFVPYIGWLISLIMWLVKKNESPLVRQHGAVLMNLFISNIIYAVIVFFVGLAFVATIEGNGRNVPPNVPPVFAILLIIFGIGAIVFGIATLVFIILNAIRASKGEAGSYPMAFKFLDNKLPKTDMTMADHLVD
jgi:hypothetical protein